MDQITITPEDPGSPDALFLIAELDAHLKALYPSESRHGFSVERLVADGVPFFLLRVDGAPAGCGAVKLFRSEYAEIKRMYMRPQFRGTGLARRLLEHLIGFAASQGAELVRLETGIHQPAAIALYERAGFRRIAPFGEYREDPLCRYYERAIPLK